MRPKIIILIVRTSTTTNGWKRSLQPSEVMISLGNGMGIFTDCCYQFAKVQYKDGETHSGLYREAASTCGCSLRWTGFPNHGAKAWDFLHSPNWDNRVWGKFGKLRVYKTRRKINTWLFNICEKCRLMDKMHIATENRQKVLEYRKSCWLWRESRRQISRWQQGTMCARWHEGHEGPHR